MKEKILLCLFIAISMGLLAQKRIPIPENIRNFSIKKHVNQTWEKSKKYNGNRETEKSSKAFEQAEVGYTVFDLQTNASNDHRCYLYPDGTVATTFTFGTTAPNFQERGSGYQYFDGSMWDNMPTNRIESVNTGWPSYSHLGANGEVVIAHNGTQLVMNKRTNKGTGTWAESYIPVVSGTTPMWPRIAVFGNKIHILASNPNGTIYQGQNNSLLYYRSQDGGATWDIQAQIIPGLDAASGFVQGYGPDCYAWSEPKGDTIAFVVGNHWTDLSLMKSLDGGNTWTKTIIFQHPYPNFQENTTLVTDSPFVCDGHLAVQLDNFGKAHVVFGIMRVLNDNLSDGETSYFPATDGLAYWKEGNPAFPNLNPDLLFTLGKLAGWMQDHNGNGVLFDNIPISDTSFANYGMGSLTSQPQISIDNNGDIYIIFTSIVEDQISWNSKYYNHIWGRKMCALSNSWGNFIEITGGMDYDLVECLFPAFSKTLDSRLHFTFLYDFEPGLAITGESPIGYNSIFYIGIDKIDFDCGTGNFNLSGIVFNDENQNGIKDPLEQGVAEHMIRIDPGPYFTTTDNNGFYGFAVDTGNYCIRNILPQYWVLTTDSNSYTLDVTDPSNTVTTLDFGVIPKLNIQDVSVSLTGSPTRPGFETKYWLTYKNLGTTAMSGLVNYEYYSSLNYLSSFPVANNINGNLLDFNYDTLAYHEQRTILSRMQIPSSMSIGDSIFSFCMIDPLVGDTNTFNNYDTLRQVVTGSFDPNDKAVSPTGILGPGYVLHGQKLTYTIRFQNTGNDTAFTVMIKDTLDLDFETETFNILASSHPVTYTIQGSGIITFTFNNILLPDSNVNEPASNGFVKYSIEPKPGLADFTEVRNKAYIYFDYNPPVITNEVLNTYVSTLTTIKEPGSEEIVVYPNPVEDELNIRTSNNLTGKDFSLFDIYGRKILGGKIKEKITKFSVEYLAKGVYILQINGGQKASFRIIKK